MWKRSTGARARALRCAPAVAVRICRLHARRACSHRTALSLSPSLPPPFSNVVGSVVKAAGASSSVDASNIAETMEAISKEAAVKTAYLADNRDDISSGNLAAVGTKTSAAITKQCMDIADPAKIADGESMHDVIEHAAKGSAAGAGVNTHLKTDGTLITAYIAAAAAGSSTGIAAGVASSSHTMFKAAQDAVKAKADDSNHVDSAAETAAQADMAWKLQHFSTAVSGGSVQGSLAINTPNYNSADLGNTVEGVTKSSVTGCADFASKYEYFKAEHIANSTTGTTTATTGAIGSTGTFQGNAIDTTLITDLINKGAEGTTDGLGAVDTAKVPDYTEGTYNTAIAGIAAGTISGIDEINRDDSGVTVSSADFTAITGATTDATTTYATTVGGTKWTVGGSSYDDTVLKETIAGAETTAIKNVTSIANFDPATAYGDNLCGMFATVATCGQDTATASMASICEWDSGTQTCAKKAVNTIDFCASPATVTSKTTAEQAWHCTYSGSWCKWDATSSACVTKSPTEVQDAENLKTWAPTPPPTTLPTSANTFDFCKVSALLLTVTFHANLAHSLTRSP